MNKDNILIIDNKKKEEINIFNKDLDKLNIIIKDNAKLILNYFKDINNMITKINIEIGQNSSLILNHSYINKNNYDLNIDIKYKNEQSSAIINIYGINDKGITTLNIDGTLENNNINNILDEKIKVININNGKVICKPNMYIKTSKIIANHQNTISNINEDEQFYLMSKGISKTNANKLITTGFITSIITKEELNNQIKEYLK